MQTPLRKHTGLSPSYTLKQMQPQTAAAACPRLAGGYFTSSSGMHAQTFGNRHSLTDLLTTPVFQTFDNPEVLYSMTKNTTTTTIGGMQMPVASVHEDPVV